MDSGFDSHDWSEITSLYFYQGGRLYSHVSPAGDDPSSIASLNEYLAYCLPNLKRVDYESLVDDSLYQENPFNRLINSRLSNLREVVIGSQHYPLLTAPSFSPCLTTLSIRCRSQGAVQLPHIVAQSLVELCLTEIPAMHVWNLIDAITVGQQGIAQFPHLRKIDFDFAQDRMAGGDMGMPMDMVQPWARAEQLPTAHHTFPSLQKLLIRRYPFSIREYLVAFPCDQLASFMLEGSGRGMLSVDASQFRTLREAHIASLGIFRYGEDRAEKFLQNVLGVPSPMRKLKVTLISHSNIRIPRQFGCELLQSLDLRVPVRLSAVETAIRNLRHLWRINIPYTKTDVQDPVDSIELLRVRMRQQLQGPVFVSTSVQQLELGFWDYKQPTTSLCYHVLMFISRIPSLLIIITESNFATSLRGIVTYLPSDIAVLPSTRVLQIKSNSL
ncbi:hypothetical protein FBU59_004185 [Linderina macrospora]|uniref:Uncharacterized protein n=1 Tax=Linderina macrospora TaxID=4868 RepID=A0ACC1J6F6_9FUNG|nr:hypothetical protein FBU59_004185 [Linderina macrospora]